MLEYVFFDAGLRNIFAAFLHSHGVEVELYDGDGYIAAISDDVDDELGDSIDLRYEQLLQENADLLEGTADGLEKNAAGVQVLLRSGEPCMIRLDPDLMARLLSSLTLEELRDMVQGIAEQVEEPDNRPLCHSR